MQSSMVVAGMDALSTLRKHFDTSGKSAALFHHRAICKTPMALSDNGFFGAIAGKKSSPTIEVASARRSCIGSPQRRVASRVAEPRASDARARGDIDVNTVPDLNKATD